MKNDEFLVEKIGLTAIVYFRNVPPRDFVLERGGVARRGGGSFAYRRRIFLSGYLGSGCRSLPTGMRCIVEWLELEHRLETLARPLGISDELDVQVRPCAEHFHFRSLVAQHSYCGRPRIRTVVHSD